MTNFILADGYFPLKIRFNDPAQEKSKLLMKWSPAES